MKRYFVLASLLAMCMMAVWAKPISKKAAQKVAQEFMQRQLTVQGSHRAPRMVGIEAAQGSQENEYVYLFNASDGQGFVVVSGDDSTEPILGYSTHGRIDASHMPQNLRSWLQHYADQIAFIQENNISVSRRTVTDCGPAIAPQMTSRWNQDPIYNDQCPMVTMYTDEACTQLYEYPVTDAEGKQIGTSTEPLRAVTGCAATSLAQTLYHHKYPAAVVADIPGKLNAVEESSSVTGETIWNKYSYDAIPAGTPIDWDHLVDAYGQYFDDEGNAQTATTTDEQNAAVAQLMHICGAAMEMSYGTLKGIGSMATELDILKGVVKYLGLPNAQLCCQEEYDYQTWIQNLYDEISMVGCTSFGGSSRAGGHAFNVDGYEKEDLFHLNWGWGGRMNGYFRINALSPISRYDFSQLQSYFRGLYPAAPAVTPAVFALKFETKETSVTAESGAFSVPSTTIILRNKMVPVMTAELGYTIEGQGIKTTTPLTSEPATLPLDQLYQLEDMTLPLGALADGTYKLYPSYRLASTDDWTACKDSEGTFMQLTVNGNTMTIENEMLYTLSVESIDGYQAVCEPGPISLTVNVKVAKGSLHESMGVYAGKVGDDGEVISSTVQLVVEKSVYAEEGETFSIPVAFQVGSECKMYLGLSGRKTGIHVEICRIEIKQGTAINTVRQDGSATAAAYNLSGQRVADDYRGIVIQNGQKLVRK